MEFRGFPDVELTVNGEGGLETIQGQIQANTGLHPDQQRLFVLDPELLSVRPFNKHETCTYLVGCH